MATPTNLPASFTNGAVLTATQMNDLRGAFRILQVVSANADALVLNSTTTYADTGLSATITPQSTSSKILVFVNQTGCGKTAGNTASTLQLRLLRASTEIAVFEAAGGYTGTSVDNYIGGCGTTYLDSPATTSAITYKTQLRNTTAAFAVFAQSTSSRSTITLMEVSA